MNKINFSLVTGAAGLLGFEHCETLLKLGYGLIMIDVNKSLLDKKYKLLSKKYKKIPILKYYVDISSLVQLKKLVKKIKRKNIFIRTIINNACIDPKPKRNVKNFIKSWDRELNVGLKGAYLIIELFTKKMINMKDGCIINIASDLSVIAPNQNIYKGVYKNFTKPVTYSVIKHGIIGMTKYYAVKFAKFNITCNAISPVGVYNNQNKKFVKNLVNLIPMGRMATTKDINNTVGFLVDRNQKFITGQNIIIDGGRTIL